MRCEVRLYAMLSEAAPELRPGEAISVEIPDADATLDGLLARLGVEPGAVHLAIVDGRAVSDRTRRLRDGARVGLFPPVGGG